LQLARSRSCWRDDLSGRLRQEAIALGEEFDIVVLGGGPAGYATALYGAAAGLNIALVEDRRVGGTCLHRGCIPAKELLQTAEVLRTVQRASEYGIGAGEPSLDLGQAQVRKQAVVDRVTKGLESLLSGRKVTVVIGRGELVDAHTVRVTTSGVDAGTEVATLTGTNLVIATGSEPRSLPGLDFDGTRILSSDHVLELTDLPPRVAIIGGGVVGCEFASMLVDMGSTVTMIEALPRILAGTDIDAGNVVARSLRKRGVNVHTDARVTGIEGVSELLISWDAGGLTHSETVDVVIVSVGRAPSTASIGLDAAGVHVDARGFVTVDGQMRTNVDGVYAAGDVVDTPALAHVGFSEAIVLVKTILGEPAAPVDYEKVPWVIYTRPEIAFCGLTEVTARERFGEVEVSTQRFGGDARAVILGETDGLVKVVASADGTLLGVHVAGPWATELLGEGYLSVNWEANAADLAALVHPHPTLGEMIGEAAMALTGRRLH
jgi:dihydrolipoamide dehydrogenase